MHSGEIVPKFPEEKELRKMRALASKATGTRVLPPNSSALDRAKWEVCKQLILFMQKKKLSQRQLALMIGVPESRISEISHYKLSKLTLDRLVNYYERIKPTVVFRVA